MEVAGPGAIAARRLPAVCERLWRGPVKPAVESALQTLSADKSPTAPRAIKDSKFQRTSATD